MMNRVYYLLFAAVISVALIVSCKKDSDSSLEKESLKGTYGYDADFLKKHTKKVIELSDSSGAKVLLSADYQGRVMTSTATGDSGSSYGWINYDLIASHEKKAQFNPVGGEERIWFGPEGGQYSIYFAPGDSFKINKWQVPAVIDTIDYDVKSSSSGAAVFTKQAKIINYSGEAFDILIERKIELLNKEAIESTLDTSLPPTVRFVAYQTTNMVQNDGANDWTKEKGLLSVWLLGMMTPTDNTTVIIPFKPGPDSKEQITTSYFGDIPQDRLQIKDSVLFFKCDGKYRSKLGLSPSIAKSIAASFDFKKNVLTVILFPVEKDKPYVNSKWEIQKEPYRGDVVNSYNDGPLADGSQLGPFYELESSSSAIMLKRGETETYSQSTIHFEGDFESMNVLAKAILGIDLETAR
jgi:hypothetical protein